MAMEDMGCDACVMVGCNERVSNPTAIYKFFQNGKTCLECKLTKDCSSFVKMLTRNRIKKT